MISKDVVNEDLKVPKSEVYVGTIIFSKPGEKRMEKVVFNRDMTKVVKCMVNYARFLALKGFVISGSIVEELDKYWEYDSTR